MSDMTRRAALGMGTILGGMAAVPTGALAFTVGEPNEDVRRLYNAACSRRQRHADLVAEVRSTLEKEGGPVSEAEVRRTVAAMSCPLCGCSLADGLSAPRAVFDKTSEAG
jgi:hypothetical protein